MGKTEIIILVVVILIIAAFIIIYLDNTKKIKSKNQENKTEKDSVSQEKQPSVVNSDSAFPKDEIKSVMEDISNQSENYIKELMLKEDENQKNNSEIKFEEVAKSEILENDGLEDAAIILGVKKKQIHVLDGYDEEDDTLKESSVNILNELDAESENIETKINSSGIDLENFEEDDSVGEEFKNTTKRMKVLMVSNIFDKKNDE